MGRHFFFTRMALSPPLDKRNTRDKAKGLRITSERYIGELVVRCLSTLNNTQDSRQQSPIGSATKRIVVYILHLYCLVYALLLVANMPA